MLPKPTERNPCFRGGFMEEGGTEGTCHHHPPLSFPRKKLPTSKKENNINKIYQIKSRLKEMTCLMTIPETKKTFRAFRFFHKHS